MAKKQQETKTLNNNMYIDEWKLVFTNYAEQLRLAGLTKLQIKNNIKKQAQYQLESLNRLKPDKTKTMEEQANDYQLTFINWIKEIADTGEL